MTKPAFVTDYYGHTNLGTIAGLQAVTGESEYGYIYSNVQAKKGLNQIRVAFILKAFGFLVDGFLDVFHREDYKYLKIAAMN